MISFWNRFNYIIFEDLHINAPIVIFFILFQSILMELIQDYCLYIICFLHFSFYYFNKIVNHQNFSFYLVFSKVFLWNLYKTIACIISFLHFSFYYFNKIVNHQNFSFYLVFSKVFLWNLYKTIACISFVYFIF